MAESGFGMVLDCEDPTTLAPFWAEALGYVIVGAVDNYVLLLPDDVPGPKLLLQRVPESRTAKNRMHLDIENPDIEGVATRLEQLGGRRAVPGVQMEHGNRWVVMADPEGNEFCVCDGGTEDRKDR